MTELSSQFQALLGSQGAGGFFAALGAAQANGGTAGSSPFGALLAQLGQPGPAGQAAPNTDLTALVAKFVSLGGDLSSLALNGSVLHTLMSQQLTADTEAAVTVPPGTVNSLLVGGKIPFAAAVASDVDGVNTQAETTKANKSEDEAPTDLSTLLVPAAAALIVAVPPESIPTEGGDAAPSIAEQKAPTLPLAAANAEESSPLAAIKTAMTNLIAAGDLNAAAAEAPDNTDPDNAAPDVTNNDDGVAPDKAIETVKSFATPTQQSHAATKADLIAAARDAGILGVELARVAGGRALAYGNSAVASDNAADTTENVIGEATDGNADAEPVRLDHGGNATAASKSKAGAALLTQNGAGTNTTTPSAAGGGASPDAAAAITAKVQKLGANGATPEIKPTSLESKQLPQALSFHSLLDDPANASNTGTETAIAVNTAGLAHNAMRPSAAFALSAALAAHVAGQVAVHISQAIRDGQNEFKIRLDPPELGRIDVKLEVGNDGRVIAVLAADNEKTLHLFERNQGMLEQALKDAGLKTDSGSLSFTLSGGEERAARQWTNGKGRPNSEQGLSALRQGNEIIAMASISDRALDIRV